MVATLSVLLTMDGVSSEPEISNLQGLVTIISLEILLFPNFLHRSLSSSLAGLSVVKLESLTASSIELWITESGAILHPLLGWLFDRT